MQIDQLRSYLDDEAKAASWFRSLGIVDARRAHANLVNMATVGLTLDLLANLADQLAEHLPTASDPDRALNNLDRFVAAARSPLSIGSLFERDLQALPVLLQIFATSQHLSDLLIQDNESYDLLRMTEGQAVGREPLVDEVCSEVAALAGDSAAVAKALRRIKRRETLRISYGDIVRGQSVDIVTRQISYLADALVEAAVLAAKKSPTVAVSPRRRPGGRPASRSWPWESWEGSS
jgi:glutamate-ammonia-ligase adenylyltransferase